MDRGTVPSLTDGVLTALAAFYGPLAPPPRDLFAFFVWEVVSRRALPARRDMAWQAIKRIPALTPDAMFRAPKDDLKAAIDGLGGFEERLEALRSGSGHFRRHRDLADVVAGPLLRATRALRDVPHLSPTAQLRALFFAGGHVVPAVDDETARVLARLNGVTAPAGPRRRRAARQHLRAAFGLDRDRLGQALVLLGHHAGHACVEHGPHCSVCPLAPGCQWALESQAPGSGAS
jgi:adenine-specific DNA glycosylase